MLLMDEDERTGHEMRSVGGLWKWSSFAPTASKELCSPSSECTDTLILALWNLSRGSSQDHWTSGLHLGDDKWVLLEVDTCRVICHTARDNRAICMSMQTGLLAE